MTASSPFPIQPPTYPPFQPAQSTATRNRPSATRPSPTSSGCWCPRVLRARFFRFTRLGTRGLRVRLFRRRAMRAWFDIRARFPCLELVDAWEVAHGLRRRSKPPHDEALERRGQPDTAGLGLAPTVLRGLRRLR